MEDKNHTTSPSLLRWGVRIAGVAAILIGGFWLGAWFTGYAVRHSMAGLITMKTNMALAQILCGMALLLLGGRRPSGVRQLVGALFAMIVFLLGTLTLSEHLFGLNLGIDQLLAKEPPASAATLSPNRMGYPGSLSVALLGVGLLALALKRRVIAPYWGIAVCVINLIPAVGFVYGIGSFYRLPLTGIAWPTVIALISLGIGLVFARSDSGPMTLLLSADAGGKLVRGTLPWVILIPLVLGFFRVKGQHMGLYDTAAGTGLLVISLVLIFSFMLWRSAGKLSLSEAALLEAEAQKATFYRKTILAATGGKLDIVEPEDILVRHGELAQKWGFSTADEYSHVIGQAFGLAESLGMAGDTLHGFKACVGEMLSNALRHAGGGEASFYNTDKRVLFVVSDTGPGIDSINVPDIAFVPGYTTAGTGGLGYKLIIGSADKTYLATGPSGTTVAVEISTA